MESVSASINVCWNNSSPWPENEIFTTLEKFSTEELKNGTADETIQTFIETCKDVKGLQRLAHILFSGERLLDTDMHLQILAYLFISDEADIKDISLVLKKAFASWKINYLKEEWPPSKEQPRQWPGYDSKISDNEFVQVVTGSGFSHIQKFLKDDEKTGYRCEHYGDGIYVTPCKGRVESLEPCDLFRMIEIKERSERTVKYANRFPLRHFDQPAILAGYIKAKHLQATGQISEAVIAKGKGKKLKSVSILVMKPKGINELPLIRDPSIENVFSDDLELQERIKTVVHALLEQSRQNYTGWRLNQ